MSAASHRHQHAPRRPAPGRHRAPKADFRMPSAAGVLPGAALAGLGASLAVSGALPGTAEAASGGNDSPSTAGLVTVPASARFAPPTNSELARLRMCESTGNYAVNSGNGFYGAYQFDLQTWRSLGLSGVPAYASARLQDAAASALEQTRGWQPWPACSSHLGLAPRRAHHLPVSAVLGVLNAPAAAPVVVAAAPPGKHRSGTTSGPTAVTRAAAPAHPTVAPPFGGHALSLADGHAYRSDVRTWQERMAARGWAVQPDGYFGPRTQAVARAFAAEKHLTVALPGEVNAAVWSAAWTAPID